MVMSKDERNALLAQSTYGSGGKGTAQRKTGFRNLKVTQVETLNKSNGSISAADFQKETAKKGSNISENPHQQELARLAETPKYIELDREHYEQTVFFNEVYLKYPLHYHLLASVPNGGKRDKGERFRLTAEGLKPGWPDTQLMFPSHGYRALFIEFKKPYECFADASAARGGVASHQIATIRMLRSQGFAAFIAFGAFEALKIFEAYIGVSGDIKTIPQNLFYPEERIKMPNAGEVLELYRGQYVVPEQPLQLMAV